MDKTECDFQKNAAVELNVISKLIEDIEKKVSVNESKPKECEEFKILKEKCCDINVTVSLTAFYGITYLVRKEILITSQTISLLVSLLPSIKEFGGLVSTIGDILISDFQKQIKENGKYECVHLMQCQHPFFIVLKFNYEKSWFEVYNFILGLFKMNEDMTWKHKIEFLRPVFRQIFWSSSFQGSELQLKLFNALMMEFKEKEVLEFALETFLWQELNIHFCYFIQEFFIRLLNEGREKTEVIAFGLSPLLAVVTKWLILNGCNPDMWLKILSTCVKENMASGSPVLYILSDVVLVTPPAYINQLIDVCESIILSTHCNKYVAYKFLAVILNWFVSPSILVNPVYKSLEKIINFMTGAIIEWNGLSCELNENEYYKNYGNSKKDVKFAVDFIETCNRLEEGKTSVQDWLKTLRDSNELQMLSKINAFIQGILLCEKDQPVVDLCLEILFKVIDHQKWVSFSVLCLLFYKLGIEEDPNMQKMYLFSLPKLSIKKENIPLIVGIIESLKRGPPKIMTPLIIQLYLSLWKSDRRTYSYLHKMLHDKTSGDYDWELNVSKAIALKEICQLTPHLHAKDLVGVLSGILNEPCGNYSGLPSAIAIEAVIELCKAYVIDVSGTWNAIQPKLRVERRPEIVASLCRFFGEIPNLNSSEQEKEELTKNIVPMLWEYTFFSNQEVVKSAFRALSNYPLENLPVKFFPEKYRVDVKAVKDVEKKSRTSEELHLPVSSAGCWIQFLQKIDEKILQDGGELVQVVIERELTSLPRGIFYLPPERSEPLSYSYLPSRSVCRGLVECLQKHSKENIPSTPRYLKEIIHILAHKYSKYLPPLNWTFLENYMNKNWNLLSCCLALLVKQAPVSPSAWSILENYFKAVNWNIDKLEEIMFFYNLMPLLSNSVSYGVLQNFLERTITLSLETTLKQKGPYFENIIQNLTESLKNKNVQPGHKNLIAKQMENIFHLIPPEHKIMKKFATCATEFPVKLVEDITSVKEVDTLDSEWLRRVVTIRTAIAMREDIQNPLVWLSELTEAVAPFPEEHNFILNAIWFIIRNRRDCDHRPWMNELIWKTQTYIRTSESSNATLFFIDVFITVTIILSGYDCLFLNLDELMSSHSKKLKIFPQALCDLLSSPAWSDMLQKVGSWLQKLSKWKHLSEEQENMVTQTLLALREVKSFGKENECSLFHFSLHRAKSNR